MLFCGFRIWHSDLMWSMENKHVLFSRLAQYMGKTSYKFLSYDKIRCVCNE